MMMQTFVFDNPLLIQEISRYLGRHDLAQCTLVCKDWLLYFSPELWRTFYTTKLGCLPKEVLSAFKRNFHYIRHLTSLNSDILSTIADLSPPFNCIQSIKRLHPLASYDHQDFLYLVKSSPNLQQLSLCYIFSHELNNELTELLLLHPKLQSLNVTSSVEPQLETIQELFLACSQMDSVNLFVESLAFPNTVSNLSPISFGCNTKIRKLYARFNSQRAQTFALLPLLKHCPLLEELECEYLNGSSSNTALLASLQHCPRMKTLKLFNSNYQLGDLESTELILHIADALVKNIQPKGSNDNKVPPKGTKLALTALSFDFPIIFNNENSMVFVACFGPTLSNLSLDRRVGISIQVVGELLRGLPNLEFLTAGIDVEAAAGVNFQLGIQWSCLLLKQLRLRLIVGNPKRRSIYDWKVSEREIGLHYIFSQIGRLKGLKLLELGTPESLLRFKSGYVKMLSDLKELETWDTFDSDVPNLNSQECSWILNNWPKLNHIILRNSTYTNWRSSKPNPDCVKSRTIDLLSGTGRLMRICSRPRASSISLCSCYAEK